MKMKILTGCGMAMLLASCGQDKDLLRNISDSIAVVYMPQAVNSPASYSFTRSAGTDSIIYGANYGGPHSPAADIQVQFRTNPALVEKFNTKNYTNYPLLPEGTYQLEQSSAVIPAGKYSTPALKIRVNTGKLDGVGNYLLPVSITTDAQVNEALRTTYFLINAKYTSNPFPLFDRQSWKITKFSSEEPTGEGATNGHAIHALDGNVDTYWTTEWKANKPGPPHILTIDMQAAQSLHGFAITGRTDKNTGEVKATGNPKNMIIETSLDGNVWDYTETFTLDNVKVSTIYLSYARQARFFRFTINTSQGDTYLTNIAEVNAF
ncbi:BT_3987 domain-containing protein [Chitinophaga qingshengii]|uniref:DUF1735 domain-containing protein n=1 Tax=Chitinophaga qingshengii TaxID=1569794 RepID=A0ABR7TKM1_9BACT|nr:DUF1735 domain-containing protein [Chitinophaga qingshengii]MBC9930513.1 DUF1735 domain-containing protein [Chitinophaga qingshengii]